MESDSETAVSVRALERRAGVSAPTIYRHFPDMGALIAEVAGRQFAALEAALEGVAGDPDPEAELRAYGTAYARFGPSHPHAYRVLFMNRADDVATATDRLRSAAGYQRLRGIVGRLVANGSLPPDDDPDEVAAVLIMSLHGVISMFIARPVGWGEPERLVDRMMVSVGYGLVPR